jgi:hypothetical protein
MAILIECPGKVTRGKGKPKNAAMKATLLKERSAANVDVV